VLDHPRVKTFLKTE